MMDISSWPLKPLYCPLVVIGWFYLSDAGNSCGITVSKISSSYLSSFSLIPACTNNASCQWITVSIANLTEDISHCFHKWLFTHFNAIGKKWLTKGYLFNSMTFYFNSEYTTTWIGTRLQFLKLLSRNLNQFTKYYHQYIPLRFNTLTPKSD